MIGEIVSDMHGMEQVGGMVVDAAGGGAEGEGAGPMQTSAAGRNAGPRRRRRGTGTRGLLPPPPPHPSAARSECCARGGGGSDGRETHKSRAPFNPTGFGLSFFFNPTESDPNLSKANGYPYPIRSKSN